MTRTPRFAKLRWWLWWRLTELQVKVEMRSQGRPKS